MSDMPLVDKISDYLETYKDDEKAKTLLLALGRHLDAKEYENRINRFASTVYDFKNEKSPIFSAVAEPKSFMGGFDAVLEILAFFVSIQSRSACGGQDRAFLDDRLTKAIEDARKPDYRPKLQDAAWNKEAIKINDMLALNTALRRREIHNALDSLTERIEAKMREITEYDVRESEREEIELRAALIEMERKRDDYRSTRVLPTDFVVCEMFKEFPSDQFELNISTLRGEIENVGWRLRQMNIELEQLHRARAVQEDELAKLGQGERIGAAGEPAARMENPNKEIQNLVDTVNEMEKFSKSASNAA